MLSQSISFRRVTRRYPLIFNQWKQQVDWKPAKIVRRELALKDKVELHTLKIDVGPLSQGYSKPGQFIQIKVGESKPGFFAMASPPNSTNSVLEILIKKQGETAEALCEMNSDQEVSVSDVMGKGFGDIPVDKYKNVILFATGTGISPIKTLIESELLKGQDRQDVRLYYGAYNSQCMAFQQQFPLWEKLGVQVIPVFSEKDGKYVQDVFKSADNSNIQKDPQSSCAVVVGQKEMFLAVVDALAEMGVAQEQVITNF
eukprot:TRINITY_DN6613_c1_g1_i2.p1 TRINITY_DN6613_c1_g1~~TRINITY_DN6613_c1_g1_i2.p1  ORF type:complete len:257 (-),score=30.44 TRINITY_DN6613_c1_g1_i2:282-1052(-)